MILLQELKISTPLGKMVAIGSEENLYLLQFTNGRHLEKEINKLKMQAEITPGEAMSLIKIRDELRLYFDGMLKSFNTPFQLIGSDFQNKAWRALMSTPYAKTRSYREQAKLVGNEKAFRAVANANAANQLSIIVPCHRIINHNGKLGGYAAGIERKEWLLQHEKKYG